MREKVVNDKIADIRRINKDESELYMHKMLIFEHNPNWLVIVEEFRVRKTFSFPVIFWKIVNIF